MTTKWHFNPVLLMLTFWWSKQDNVSCFNGEFLFVHRVLDAKHGQE